MEKARKIVTDYKSGRISIQQASNALMEILFTHKYEFGLAGFDEDTFSDFLVFMRERFESILVKYDPGLSDFMTYLHSVINMTAYWWKKMSHLKMENSICCQYLCIEESFISADFSPDESDFYVEEPLPDNKISLYKLKKTVSQNLQIKSPSHGRKRPLTRERVGEILSTLALKTCHDITPDFIDFVAKVNGIDRSAFEETVEKAELSIRLKVDRIKKLERKRNYSYYYRKKKILSGKNLKKADSGLSVDEVFNIHDTRWRKSIEDLDKLKPNLVPTNLTVAELLGISPRKVTALLEEAEQRADEIRDFLSSMGIT